MVRMLFAVPGAAGLLVLAPQALAQGAADQQPYGTGTAQQQQTQEQQMQQPGGQIAQAGAGVQIAATDSEQFGQYLTDAEGRAIYMFTADQQGEGGQQAMSNCYDDCAQAWPPVTAEGEVQAGPEVQEAMLDTIQRDDGQQQVTYNGWPLYYFVQDQAAGQATGQDKQGFGGEWYLVTPEGERVAEEGGG